jgi:hypothetical protein
MALKKSAQDDLKDVGGFVGGELNGPRRKAANVIGRDVITLDADNLSAGQTDDIISRVRGLGVKADVYTTAKHHPAAPRLRILIYTDRTMTADEYEPCARKTAQIIDPATAMFDPTTFEAARIMYWPRCSSDSQYLRESCDGSFISAGGLLAMYADWRDASQWPSAPGAQTFAKLAVKQGDPEGKTGVVGAFCRAYDVYRAMAELLPGIYEPVDNSPDRYTYLGGSTTGGAVIYDGGKFLYSHHATDPCGGRLVNSFDLTRLHRFGELDDEAKEGTPNNRLPSYTATVEFITDQLPEVTALYEKERGEERLREFSGVAGSPKEIEFLGGNTGKIMTTGIILKLTDALEIKIRTNEITHKAEVDGYPRKWSAENAANLLPTYLLDYLKVAGIKGATKTAVSDALDIIAEENRYNPVADTLRSYQWDGKDRLAEYCGIAGISGAFQQTLVQKWLWQSVALAFNNSAQPYGAVGVLTFQGDQQIGKTSFVREIIPLSLLRFFKESADIDTRNKDTVIEATSHWICELGEIDKLARRDQALLKAFLTLNADEYRSPYGHKSVKYPRRTAFYGTVNPDKFLADDTGNLRYFVIPVTAFDLEKLFSLSEEWKAQLWAQAYTLFIQNPQGFRLTKEEHKSLALQNQQFEKPLKYEIEVRGMFNYNLLLDQWGTFTAGEIAGRMMQRPPANLIGYVLARLAREDTRIQVKTVHKQGAYTLPILKTYAPPTPPNNGGAGGAWGENPLPL